MKKNLWKVMLWSMALLSVLLVLWGCGKESKIEIHTVEDLQNVSSELGENYILMNDLDLGGMEWTPIGTGLAEFNCFTGTFDGNGHSISNFKITGDTQYVGLFGCSRGAIENLGLKSFAIDRSSDTIFAGGLVGANYGTITNCYAMGTVRDAQFNNSSYIGGLVGENGGTVRNCYAMGDVSATSSSVRAYAGGLVGRNADGTITNSYATGDVSGSLYAGGLVGFIDGRSDTTSSCIFNSYATGNVSGAYAGGLIGKNRYVTITNCYAIGDVSGSTVGGLVGYGGRITNCYRYSGQSFTVTVNGTTTYEATNTLGTATDMATLQSVDFQQNTLGWSADDWSFAAGAHPTLKNVGLAS